MSRGLGCRVVAGWDAIWDALASGSTSSGSHGVGVSVPDVVQGVGLGVAPSRLVNCRSRGEAEEVTTRRVGVLKLEVIPRYLARKMSDISLIRSGLLGGGSGRGLGRDG